MNRILLKHFFLIAINVFICYQAVAQRNIYNWRLNIYGGYMNYNGDIETEILPFQYKRPSYGIELDKYIGKSFAWQLNYLRGNFSANDLVYNDGNLQTDLSNIDRSLNFKTELDDISVRLAFFTDNNILFYNSAFLSPYIFAGIGRSRYAVFSDLYFGDYKRYYYYNDAIYDGPEGTNSNIILQDGIYETEVSILNTEGINYKTDVWNIPFGLGIKCRISERINLDLLFDSKYYFTDYLDDISGEYPLDAAYSSNPTGTTNVYRGNPNNNNDMIYMFSLGLSWNFGKKKSNFKIHPIQAARTEYSGNRINNEQNTESQDENALVEKYIYKYDTTYTDDTLFTAYSRNYYLDSIATDTIYHTVKKDSLYLEPVYAINNMIMMVDSVLNDSTSIQVKRIVSDTLNVDYALKSKQVDSIIQTILYKTDTVYSDNGPYTKMEFKKMLEMKIDSSIIDSVLVPITHNQNDINSESNNEEVLQQQLKQPNEDANNIYYLPLSNGDNSVISNPWNSEKNHQKMTITPGEKSSFITISNATDSVTIEVKYPAASVSENSTQQTTQTKTAKQKTTDENAIEQNKKEAESTGEEINIVQQPYDENLSEQFKLLRQLIIAQGLVNTVGNIDPNKKQEQENNAAILNMLDSINTTLQNKKFDTSVINVQIPPVKTVAAPDVNIGSTYVNSGQNTLLMNTMISEIALLKKDLQSLQLQLNSEKVKDTVYMVADKEEPKFDLPSKQIIYYKVGKSQPDATELAALDNLVNVLNQNPDLKIKISSYADKTGSSANNKTLTQKRADFIKNYLLQKGVSVKKITAKGYGDEFSPAGANDQVRRSEIEVIQ